MNSVQFLGAVELGLIYGLVALGTYISFRVLDFPDLTVDGSFPLGAAVASVLILSGYNPWLAMLASVFAGGMAGVTTALINVRLGIPHLLAGILTMTGLYSVNLRIMGRPNVPLLAQDTIFSPLTSFMSHELVEASLISVVVLLVILIIGWFLNSEVGLALRATGQNPKMAVAQGVRTGHMIVLGIMLSNGLVALAGAIFAQSQGFADVNIGIGTIIVGLVAVLIGESIAAARAIFTALILCVLGSVIYRVVLALALNADFLGFQASDLNLVTAILVVIAMVSSKYRKNLGRLFKQKGKGNVKA